MKIELSIAEYKRLLDLVFLGNVVLGLPNPQSEESRLYDKLTRDIFSYCPMVGLGENVHIVNDELYPSDRYCESGVMQKLLDYEDSMVYDILAEELARRDLEGCDVDGEDNDRLLTRMGEYFADFTANGFDHLYDENVEEST